MIEIIVATGNLHKLREFREIFKIFGNYEIISLNQFPEYSLPAEEGKTFQENANIKAEHAARNLGKIVLADDSGLVVPALNGAPGVFSRRFAGEQATDADNRKKLLADMRHLQDMQRAAYFECSLAIASPEKILKTVTAICEGAIALEERGRDGFGYDSIFIKSEYDKTLAELGEAIKNRISHRRKAFEKLVPFLTTQLPKFL